MAGSFPDPAMQSLLTAARRISNQAATADHNPSQHRPFSRPPSRSELELRSALGNSRPGSRSDLELKSALGNSRPGSRTDLLLEAKRPSSIDNLIMEEQRRRLSEAGVNRRPSAAQVLTEDTDSFIIGQRVFVDGVKPGRIQFIGDTKFGPGDWAGVFLDEPIGKNDGSVQTTRYFTCEPRHGVFSRLFRLTREPIEGAEEILNQCKRFGYEIMDMPENRRSSVNGGSRRGSVDRGSLSPMRSSTPESRSPRRTPEPFNRASPETGNRRGSIGLVDRRNSFGERRGSLGIPARKVTHGKSPLASPNNTITRIIKIERDPDIERLASEARRLSMGGGLGMGMGGGSAGNERRGSNADSINRRDSQNRLGISPARQSVSPRLGISRRQSEHLTADNGRRHSESINGRASPLPPNHICHQTSHKPPSFSRKQSDYLDSGRRGSYTDQTHASRAKRESSLTRRGSGAGFDRRGSGAGFGSGYNSLPRRGSNATYDKGSSSALCDSLPRRRGSQAGLERRSSSSRRNSEDVDAAEMQRRRLSEAGLRRPSATEIILNDDTDSLMVGQEVWVDGTKKGRIAYIGTVHFSKGEMAGVHLDRAEGKNNGTIGGILYFQTEPRHGLFSKLHRLALYPLPDNEE